MIEEEKKRLDEEMELRRRRVKEWQEQKRLEEEEAKRREQEAAAGAGTPAAAAGADGDSNAGKKWTLDGEESDEEGYKEDSQNAEDDGGITADLPSEVNDANVAAPMEEDEIDPLDAFMSSMVLPEVAKLETAVASMESMPASNMGDKNGKSAKDAVSNGDKKGQKKAMGRIMQGDDSDSDYDDDDDDEGGSKDEDDEEFMKRVKKTKATYSPAKKRSHRPRSLMENQAPHNCVADNCS
ncbi:hypothetical protein OsI_27844 [Oryza sativa Indica Group]|uniref:Uncharacterized protein n=1 Tax=Oryza sativa subsp. indica TaxID=39946 RepID=B8BAV6_ORYSI|nr:hypothetical protein OsI_27844 [Oryza sativa Indica Group]